MDAQKVLTERRSIKKYKPTPVESEKIDMILAAGMNAPTGRNLQAPIILAITNKELRDRISLLNAQAMGASIDPFYDAPAVLVVLADRTVPTYIYDGSLVMGNMLNAAHALGLGACWIHRAKEVFDSPEGKQLLKDLGIEGDYEGIGNCIVGYSDCDYPEASARKSNYVYKAM